MRNPDQSGNQERAATPKQVSEPKIEILSQLIDDTEGSYRVRAGNRVHYVTISTNTFDDDTMCRPYLLIPKLPHFPDADWTTMRISQGPTGSLKSTIFNDPLPAVQTAWHPRRIEVLSLKQTKRLRSNVHEVVYNGRPAISKIACFKWDIPQIQIETRAYSFVSQHQSRSKPPIAPMFLGHLTENGRVMGFLLEKVDGDCASTDDLLRCKRALCRLHGMGLIHGDVNPHNFIVDRSKGHVRMIDFEHAKNYDEKQARLEIESLASQFDEGSGRGGPAVERS